MGLIKKVAKHFFYVLPINKRKVVMLSFAGGGYGCNPKYIADEMLKRKSFKIYWLYSPKRLKDLSCFPEGVTPVRIGSWGELYHLCTAGVLISNARSYFWDKIRKRAGQRYIQTWHGNMCFKKIEGDCDTLDDGYINLAKIDSRNTDLLLCGSKWRADTCFYRSFFYSGPISTFGLPRNDILFSSRAKDIKERVCEQFGIDKCSNILLYAPTFRDSRSLSMYSLDYGRVKQAMEERFGGKWVVLSRLHPNLIQIDNVLPNLPYVKDASKYPDMQELLLVSDVMITDYSGCAFDFVLTKRPILLFATDIEEYTKERDFYFDLSSTPFSIAENNDMLIENISKFDDKKYAKRVGEFLTERGVYDDGHAAEKCVNIIEHWTR